MIRRELDPETALIGFSGSPWTLANFMMEEAVRGNSWGQAHALQRPYFERVCAMLEVIIDYLNLQIRAGVDAVQIFDTLGGTLAGNQLEEGSLRWIRQIVAGLDPSVPCIVFSKEL